jgi:hypothetical protein
MAFALIAKHTSRSNEMHVPSRSRPLKMISVASLITFQIPLVYFKSLLTKYSNSTHVLANTHSFTLNEYNSLR